MHLVICRGAWVRMGGQPIVHSVLVHFTVLNTPAAFLDKVVVGDPAGLAIQFVLLLHLSLASSLAANPPPPACQLRPLPHLLHPLQEHLLCSH